MPNEFDLQFSGQELEELLRDLPDILQQLIAESEARLISPDSGSKE